MAIASSMLEQIGLADLALWAAIQLERARAGMPYQPEVLTALADALAEAGRAQPPAGGLDTPVVGLRKFVASPEKGEIPELVQTCLRLRRQLNEKVALQGMLTSPSWRLARAVG